MPSASTDTTKTGTVTRLVLATSRRDQAARELDVRVLLVADQPMMRTGLGHILRERRGVWVTAEVATAEAVAAASHHQPHVVVLVSAAPERTTIETIRATRVASPDSAVVLLTSACVAAATGVHDWGVGAIVSLEQPGDALLNAIRKVFREEPWLSRDAFARLAGHACGNRGGAEGARLDLLTRREREVVVLVGEGLRNAQIAGQLRISPATVRNHLTSILAKLELTDRFDLAVFAFRHRLVRYP